MESDPFACVSDMIDKEEQVIILYALYRCGGKGRKARIIHYIIENQLL